MFNGDTRNNQHILNYFIEQFVVNGVPRCSNSIGACMYGPHDENQIGCAVGCLIDSADQELWDNIEDPTLNSIASIASMYIDEYEKYFDGDQLGFLTRLQAVHDSIDRSFTLSIVKLAEDFALTIPEDLREDVDSWEAKYVHG